ncbi:MAG: hypothetical protein SWY16_05105 [Cyanobacteriota bacterium]|nr:hypothetical protein [Cyanobacteriota bacterium]
MSFTRPQPENSSNPWKRELDRFVRNNKQELAALAWGLYQEQQESGNDCPDTLGIDLQPTPHFFSCSREAIETLDRNVGNRLREVLGILDGHQPDKEVLILGIGGGQIQLVQYKSEPTPPECFTELGETIDTLLERLESRMVEQISIDVPKSDG